MTSTPCRCSPPPPAASADLSAIARRARSHVVRMAGRGGCFVGAALSCVDLLTHLYGRVLRVTPDRLDDPDRDILLLSKGHAVPALYGVLTEFGFFPADRLDHHLSGDQPVYWHPNRSIPGIEFMSGSLGHLLPVGIGVALDARLAGSPGRTVVVVGDGELNEGTNWEACLVAQAHRLDNLTVVVDRNRLQANIATENLVPLEPIEDKFRAFGWSVIPVDGHDFAALEQAFATPPDPGRPRAVIAQTVRGKGVPEWENRTDKWFVALAPADVERIVRILEPTGHDGRR